MKRIILSLILLFPLFLFAQPTSSTETDASDNGELFENIMKLIESPDYSSPQREFALETIRQFQEMAASPDFNPVEFEKYASELIDSLVETYQFIAASVIIQYAYQILLPYYNGPDLANFNLDYLATSVCDFYLSAKVYHKAAKWFDTATNLEMITGRTNTDHWLRNIFNSVAIFSQFDKIDITVKLFEKGMESIMDADKDLISPYTINAMFRAAMSLIGKVEKSTFNSVVKYMNSDNDFTLINNAKSFLFRAKLLSQYFNDHKDAYKLYKQLLDSPVFFIGFEEALGDMLEAAWLTDRREYLGLALMTIHQGRDLVELTLNSFSPNNTEYYWKSVAEQLNHGLGVYLNDEECGQFEYQGIFLNAVFTKALSVLNQRELYDFIKEHGSDIYKTTLKEILEIRHKMANTTDKELRDRYEGELENNENAIRQGMDLSWMAGQQNQDAMLMPQLLDDGECEIEIIEYPCYENGEFQKSYGAFVCTKQMIPDKLLGCDMPREHYDFIPLGPVGAWEMFYNGLENEFTDKDRARQYDKDEILSIRYLFSPLFKHLQENGLTKAYVSPTGVLNMINIGALPWGTGDSIVNDKIEIVRINAAYDVKNILKRDTKINSAIVFSNIDYNNTDKEKEPSIVKEDTPLEISGYRVSIEKGNNLTKFTRLPIDGKQLSEAIRKGTKEVTHYSSADATEDRFKQLNGHAPDLIHIDTHGFYIPEGDQAYIGKHVINGTQESALLTCGLAMSGANKAWSGEDVEPGSEDGILTAWEIACMDLSGCKLAVLSACETAQGKVDNINGVIGLQRALRLAGVQAMLLTLWPVDNELTEEFINDFYSRLPHSSNFNEAFIKTQETFRKRHTNPYHWAPFILIN